jgi:6-pyruvoyltetrahydropterin/6-carboxytetrahydropterin synthase
MHQYYPAPMPHPYKFELNKDMHFAAAHFVPHDSAGKCQFMHGHTYVVNVTIAGNTLDDAGFLVDFRQLKNLIEKRYDHTLLNESPEFDTVYGTGEAVFPTSETLARQIAYLVQDYLNSQPANAKLLQVIVRETPESYVVYRP